MGGPWPPRDGRLEGPRLGPIVQGGVVRGAGRPPAVRPVGTRGPPVDRVRLAPRDEPAPRPRRLRERDRGARPREPEPDPLGGPRHGPRRRRPPWLDHLGQRGTGRLARPPHPSDRGSPPLPLGRPDRLLAVRAPGRVGDGHPGVVTGVLARTVRFPPRVPPGPPRLVPNLRPP